MSRGVRCTNALGQSGSYCSSLSNAMVTSTRRAPCEGCTGCPASVMKRLDRDARDAPRVRRLLCSLDRVARDRDIEGTPERRDPPNPMPHGVENRTGARRSGLQEQARSERDGAAEADRPFIARARRKLRDRERRILKGTKKAHGRVGHQASETAVDGTDSSTEQSLEGGRAAGGALKGGCGNAKPGGTSSAAGKRQEGIGRGDTVRL